MDLRRILLLVVVTTLAVSSVAAVGVFAQAGGAPTAENETNETTGPTVTGEVVEGGSNETAGGATNETAGGLGPAGGAGAGAGGAGGGAAGGAGGGGGSGGGVVGAAQGAAQGALNAGSNIGTSAAQTAANLALGPVFSFVLDIPTIDIGLLDGDGYHAPDNEPYATLFPTLYVRVALPITAALFVPLTFVAFAGIPFAKFERTPFSSTYSAWNRAARAVAAIFGGIVFHLIGFSIIHRLFAGFTEELVGSPGELIEAMGLLDFTLATAFVGMGLYEMGWEIIKWIGVMYAIILIFLYFFPMVSMPFTAYWLYAPRSTIGKFSGYLHVTHFGLLVSKAAVGVQLFAAAMLDWSASFDGLIAGFVQLGLVSSALVTPPLVLIFMWLSKGRVLSAVGAGAGAAAGSSAVAEKVREKAPDVDTEKVKEKGKGFAKRKGAAAQGKWWDVKNRSAAMASVARGSAAGAAYAGKDRINRWRSDEPGAGSSSRTAADGGTAPTRSERLRRFEDMNDRVGGLSTSQRKRYFHLKMEEKGAFDSGLDNSEDQK